ncbi:MAG: transposase family protein [Actinobacteria bacterium]|nr:transposase family protein [Actinomycetota bacterium]
MNEAIFEYYQEREDHTLTMAEDAMEVEEALNEEEEEHDPSQVCWRNLCDDDARTKVITGFECEAFLALFEEVEDVLPVITGRGMRSKISNHDKLLMTLCYLKHYETLDKMKETFHISKSHLQRVIDTTIAAIEPVLYRTHVSEVEAAVPEEGDEFPMARYVMDVTFQPIWTPLGTYNERKRWYSGKHKQYGVKSQCIHDRKGKVVHVATGIHGSVHDLTIARQTIDVVRL